MATKPFRHPELQEGEVLLCNVYCPGGDLSEFFEARAQTKRLGNECYGNFESDRAPFPRGWAMRPVFVRAEELDRLHIPHDGNATTIGGLCRLSSIFPPKERRTWRTLQRIEHVTNRGPRS